MTRSRICLIGTTTFAATCGLAALLATGEPPAAGKAPPSALRTFKPVQSVEKLMEGQDMLFKDIKDCVQDQDWRNGATSSWVLAELANVNQFQGKDQKYQDLANRMAGECSELAKIMRKRQVDPAKEQMTKISQTCKACHDAYRKKR